MSMAFMLNLHPLYSPVRYSSTSFSYKPQTPAFGSQSQSQSLLKSKKRFTILVVQTRKRKSQIYAAQSSFFRVLQTAYKVGKNGIEAGTSLVPESVPRPVARVSVAVVGASVVLFLIKSILSTAFFFLATAGLIYSAFIAFNKDEGPKVSDDSTTTSTTTTSSDDETLEEARRIMEKYK